MKYNKNEDYFNKIDTEDKAYFLGLLYADGYIGSVSNLKTGVIVPRNTITLALQLRDEHILKDFINCLKSNYPIYSINNSNKSKKWQDQRAVTISSFKMKQDLLLLGCMERKTFLLNFPTKEQVPEHLIHHFIRGYFDGDGCIWIGKRKQFTFNDSAIGHRRTRIIHNMKFNFVGNLSFISSLQEKLIRELELNRVKINKHNKCNSVQLEYSGKNNIIKLYQYMYQDAKHFIIRKKDKFEEIISINCANI